MGFGYVEGVTHDYKRHGTTTLFAALNVLNGAVLAACNPRHRHQEFLAFLREIDKAVPAELDIHCIADNYATYSMTGVRTAGHALLEARRRNERLAVATMCVGGGMGAAALLDVA